MENRLAALRRLLRIHVNWLTLKLLGKELLSKEELAELKNYGKLSLGDEVGLIDKAFALGHLDAVSKKSSYKETTLENLSRRQKKKYSSVEELSIREAKLHAVRHIQLLSDEVSAGAFARINKASQDLMADAATKLQDSVAIALKEKKTAQRLASELSNFFDKGFKKNWYKFAVTEMHRAKVRGTAMAIVNKVDIYGKSDGIDSLVSIVPNKGACPDCEALYLDKGGNPKVFSLKELVARGSNSDPGTSHTRGMDGLHTGWIAVMPPAHPHCYCTLVYVPPGMSWISGKLKVTDQARYKDHISKAVDKGSMSPVVKPPGPKSTQGADIPKAPSLPGLAAPGNVPGPGRGNIEASSGPKVVYEYWGKRSGSPDPKRGWEQSDTGKWRRPVGAGGGGSTEVEDTETSQQDIEGLVFKLIAIEDWKVEEHSSKEVLKHLEKGEIIRSKPLAKVARAKSGITVAAEKIDIADNGSAIMKPALGIHGREVHREVAAYKMFTFFGSDRCRATGIRIHEGKLASSQSWAYNYTPGSLAYKELSGDKAKNPNHGTLIKTILDKSSNKEALKRNLEDICIMDMVMCNLDRHLTNFMVSDDFTAVTAIDHGFSFGRGYGSYKNYIHDGFNSNNMSIKLTPEMKERFENTSLSDLTKALGDNVDDWEISQSYLRMKYILDVQEREGHLSFSEFGFPSTKLEPRSGGNEKFEDFVLDFIDTHSDNPKSSEYASAQYFRDIGVLMDPEKAFAPSAPVSRKEGDQFVYEKVVRVKRAIEESKRSGKGNFAQERLDEVNKVTEGQYAEKKLRNGKKLFALRLKHEKAIKAFEEAEVKFRATKFGQVSDAQRQSAMEKKQDAVYSREFVKGHLIEALVDQKRILSDESIDQVKGERKVYENIIPLGHEDTFNRLNAAIDRAVGGKIATKITLVSKYKGVRPKKKNAAADIEAAKRQTAMKTTEKMEA